MHDTFHQTEASAYACYYAHVEAKLACNWPRERNGGWVVRVQTTANGTARIIR